MHSYLLVLKLTLMDKGNKQMYPGVLWREDISMIYLTHDLQLIAIHCYIGCDI